METYLQRLYLNKRDEEGEAPRYPVWDYRSRRSGLSTTLSCGDGSTLSSASSFRSEMELSESGSSLSSSSGSDMDLAALRDPARLTFDLLVDPHEMCPLLDVYEPLVGWIDPDLRMFHACERPAGSSGVRRHVHSNANGNFRSMNSGHVQSTSKNHAVPTSISRDTDIQNGPAKGGISSRKVRENSSEILPDDVAFQRKPRVHATTGTVKRIGGCVNAATDAANRSGGCVNNLCSDAKHLSTHSEDSCRESRDSGLPSLAVVLFLYEEDAKTGGRIDSARRHFEHPPWKLHHCEHAQRRNLNLNRQALDYFFISEDLPLWAVRQVHYGKEHIRVVVHAGEESWSDMVQFYRLILGFEPDLLRDDFCLFTVYSQINFDIQFALKKIDSSSALPVQPVPMQSARLKFKVADLGRLVPLFPNVCQPVSDSCWLTTDHDGNEVILDVTGHCGGSSSSGASSGSERASSESCTSASSSDVSFDSHDSGVCHGSVYTPVTHTAVVTGRSTRDNFVTEKSTLDSFVSGKSTLDTFKRRKSRGAIKEPGCGSKKGQRRVTFCLDDVPPRHSSPSPPSCPSQPQDNPQQRVASPSPPESRFNLRFDTCPTAPLLGNKRREEQIGFYV